MIHTVLFFAETAPAQGQGSPLSMLVPFVCIGVIFYFLVIRPQSQKAKQAAALISALKTGDKVVTSGGLHGLISNVKETTVMVKIADNVKVEVDKSAVVSVTKSAAGETVAAS